MRLEEVLADIKQRVRAPIYGATLKRCPRDLIWVRLPGDAPVQYAANGPRGGRLYVGVATHVGSRVISFGAKGSGR